MEYFIYLEPTNTLNETWLRLDDIRAVTRHRDSSLSLFFSGLSETMRLSHPAHVGAVLAALGANPDHELADAEMSEHGSLAQEDLDLNPEIRKALQKAIADA